MNKKVKVGFIIVLFILILGVGYFGYTTIKDIINVDSDDTLELMEMENTPEIIEKGFELKDYENVPLVKNDIDDNFDRQMVAFINAATNVRKDIRDNVSFADLPKIQKGEIEDLYEKAIELEKKYQDMANNLEDYLMIHETKGIVEDKHRTYAGIVKDYILEAKMFFTKAIEMANNPDTANIEVINLQEEEMEISFEAVKEARTNYLLTQGKTEDEILSTNGKDLR